MVLSDRDLKKRLKTVAELGLPEDLLDRIVRREPPQDIISALTDGLIVISEVPPDEWFDGDTMDLAFGNIIEMTQTPLEKVKIDDRVVIRRFTVDLRHGSAPKRFDHLRPVDTIEEFKMRFVIGDDETVELQPGMRINAYTKQFICVPFDLQMMIGGRSRIARSGISVHISSPVLHPGWCGHPMMEVKNDGELNFNVFPGLQFASVHFNRMTSQVGRPYIMKSWAQFSGQR